MNRKKFTVRLAAIAIPISMLCSNSLVYADKSTKSNVEYIVKKGDSVSSIAENFKPEYFKTSNFVVRIQVKNNVNECIYPGQKLIIPVENTR